MDDNQPNLSIARNLKIGIFHLGSGMADVLTTGVWNRIMISDLGFAATPVSLLLALRYFLAPLGIWAGRVSDDRLVGGYRRLMWIWFGRLLMVLSTIGVGLTTAQLARGALYESLEVSPLIWAVLALSLMAFSFGNAISGSTFLALIYDRSADHQRGRAVGIVWTFLLVGFTIAGIMFAILLPESEGTGGELTFTPEALQTLFLITALVLGSIWFFSLIGEERRHDLALRKTKTDDAGAGSIREDLRLAWDNRQMRYFMFYLALSMLFAFSQDAILEPFAGDVFGMEARITNRFSAYWGSMAILGSIVLIFLSRRYQSLTNRRMSVAGVVTLFIAFVIFSVSALAEIRPLVTPGLIVLGIGLGIWNIGTLGLMMDMSPLGRAGTFLGFWTLVVTFGRGFGISISGPIRDILLATTSSHAVSYGAVFVIGAGGLLLSLWTLRQVNVKAFKKTVAEERDMATILAGAMD